MQTHTFYGEVVGDRPFQGIYRVEHVSTCVVRLYDLNDCPVVMRTGKVRLYYPRSVSYLDGI